MQIARHGIACVSLDRSSSIGPRTAHSNRSVSMTSSARISEPVATCIVVTTACSRPPDATVHVDASTICGNQTGQPYLTIQVPTPRPICSSTSAARRIAGRSKPGSSLGNVAFV